MNDAKGLFETLLFLICASRAKDGGAARGVYMRLRAKGIEPPPWLNGQMMVADLYLKVLTRYAMIWIPKWVLGPDGKLDYL